MQEIVNQKPHSYVNVIACLIIALTASSYLLILIKYALNIPMGDDFIETIPFILQYSKNTGIVENISLIFSQYNDHRIATNRIIYSLIYSTTGQINFYTITIIGNINLLALIICYYREIKSSPIHLITLASICSLLFQISCTRAALWPMAVVANYTVITFGLLSLLFLNGNSRWSLPLAIAFAAAATFTFASGQFVLVAGCVLLLTNSKHQESPLINRKNIIWVVASLLILIAFYSGVSEKRFSDHIVASRILTNEHNYIGGFFKLIGSPFAYGNHLLAGTIGTIGVLALAALTYFQAWKQHVLFAFSLYLLACLLVISLTRSWAGHDYLVTYADRYRFIAFNYWVCILLLTLRSTPRHALRIAITVMSLTFLLCVYTYDRRAPVVREYHHERESGFKIWQDTGNGKYLKNPIRSAGKAQENLRKLIDRGLYTPPDLSEDNRAR